MGTRADFYIGIGKDATWAGSVAWDGYEWADRIIIGSREGSPLLTAKTEAEFKDAVKKELSSRDDFTSPEMGWPWPWGNSSTTDYSYHFVNGNIKVGDENTQYPNMSHLKNVTLGTRSGLIVITEPQSREKVEG